jgi:hypothetical protein
MIGKGIKLIKSLVDDAGRDEAGSIAITDEKVLKSYVDDEDFPFLVSFPRTGSHWLRMLMELYFERPSLVRVFYYKDKSDYLTLHTHDMDLDVFRKNVIYLYRSPVPTIYSQLSYEKEDIKDADRVSYWSSLYARHLKKWLIEESLSEKKSILRYENMLGDIDKEFSIVTEHFGVHLEQAKLKEASVRTSKKELKKKTAHDDKVVDLSSKYSDRRLEFAEEFRPMIEDIIFGNSPELQKFF